MSDKSASVTLGRISSFTPRSTGPKESMSRGSSVGAAVGSAVGAAVMTAVWVKTG